MKLNLKILEYIEEGMRVAHCLEMDIVGIGNTFAQALKDLDELIEMQVSFAVANNQPDLLYHPAPARYFEIYNKLADE